MYTISLKSAPILYKNRGQQKQVDFIYTMTNQITKADNIPYTASGDYMGIQIKSAKATICKGTDIKSHIKKDAATEYAYVTENRIAYMMNPLEYIDFVNHFATVTTESAKNGGTVKMRFKSETRALLEYLEMRV